MLSEVKSHMMLHHAYRLTAKFERASARDAARVALGRRMMLPPHLPEKTGPIDNTHTSRPAPALQQYTTPDFRSL